jgi:predicted dehydrogenase
VAEARVGIVGAGWRLGAYRRVIEALPGEFTVQAALTRTEASAERMREWAGAATTSMSEFLAAGPFDFVLLSVPRAATLDLAGALLDAGVPVLCETPIAAGTEALVPFLRRYGPAVPLQSAEQYRLQPMHAARLAVARSGLLGDVAEAAVSVAHEYHAMSLARAALGLGFEDVEVTAVEIQDRAVQPLGRNGWAGRLEPAAAARTVATLRFPGRDSFVLYDWTDEQYFSPIRSRSISFRGARGELTGDAVRWIERPGEPVVERLTRWDTGLDGDLEGHALRHVALGSRVLWRNPFGGARLADDELAVAAVLRGMAASVRDGIPLYPIADAAEDSYLTELIAEAARSGRTVRSTPRPWAAAHSVLG